MYSNYFILLFYLILIVLPPFIYFIYRRANIRCLSKETIKISKAQEGSLILKGKVERFEELLLAPLSQRPCCGYFYAIYDRSNYDKIVYSETRGIDFILNDGSGRCLVRSDVAGNFYNSIFWPPIIRSSNYPTLEDANKHNDLTKKPHGKRYRYMEYRRQEGETIYVEGSFKSTQKDLNLALLNLNGVIEGETKEASININPAYSGSSIHSSNKGHWLLPILDIIFHIV